MTTIDRLQAEYMQRKHNRSKTAKKQASISIYITEDIKRKRLLSLQGSIYKTVSILEARTEKFRMRNGKM